MSGWLYISVLLRTGGWAKCQDCHCGVGLGNVGLFRGRHRPAPAALVAPALRRPVSEIPVHGPLFLCQAGRFLRLVEPLARCGFIHSPFLLPRFTSPLPRSTFVLISYRPLILWATLLTVVVQPFSYALLRGRFTLVLCWNIWNGVADVPCHPFTTCTVELILSFCGRV